jgi:hypothetical protein
MTPLDAVFTEDTRRSGTATEVRRGEPLLAHPDWRIVQRSEDGAAYQHRHRPLTLIWSVAVEADGLLWQHMSMSHRDRTPTWAELIEAKEWLMGSETYAYQVAPPRAVYVNEHPYVLHLFRCLDGDGRRLPEFSGVVAGKRSL